MKYTLEDIRELPEAVRDHIFDGDVIDKYVTEIFADVDDDVAEQARDLLFDVYFKVLAPADFLVKLKELLDDNALYVKIAPKILGYDLLRISDWLGVNIAELIAKEGGDPNLFKKRIPASEFVAQVRRKADLSMLDERMSQRVDKILESQALGARQVDQALELMTGSTKTSGVGLDEATAMLMAQAADAEFNTLGSKGIVVVPDDVYANELQQQAATVAAAAAAAESARAVAEVAHIEADKPTAATVLPEDLAEIEALKQKAAETKPTSDPAALAERYVDQAVAESGLKLVDIDMLRRFRLLVSLYLRDLRDSMETQAKLTMPTASGGMGMTDADADMLMQALSKIRESFEAEFAKNATLEKTVYVAEQARKQLLDQEIADKREAEEMDKRYSALVKRSGIKVPAKEEPSAPTAPAMPSAPRIITVVAAPVETVPAASAEPEPVPQAEAAPLVSSPAFETEAEVKTVPPPLNLPGEAPAAVTPQPAVSAPIEVIKPAVSEQPSPLPTMPPPMTKPAPVPAPMTVSPAPKPTPVPTMAAPMPAPVRPPVAPIPMPIAPAVRPTPAQVAQPVPAKPVVADIKYTPRLTGPVEELRSLTLKDFVRLSKDPREATLKIKDKIDLLGEQSFEVKTQGIKAWQDSETNRLYLEILRQSLEGKPVIEVITERESSGKPTLNKAQFDSIMALNRTLRFG